MNIRRAYARLGTGPRGRTFGHEAAIASAPFDVYVVLGVAVALAVAPIARGLDVSEPGLHGSEVGLRLAAILVGLGSLRWPAPTRARAAPGTEGPPPGGEGLSWAPLDERRGRDDPLPPPPGRPTSG